jgi:hypothetical protein
MTRRREPPRLVDFRDVDWSQLDLSGYGEREALKFRLAVKALEDEAVVEATYQLANFGDFATPRSWQEHGPATWLMAAFMAAAALGRLPGGDEI